MMKIEELRSRITPLTKKEKYYKSHPNHSGDYIEKYFNEDDEKLILITHNQQVNPIDEIILTHKCQEN